MSFSLRAIIQTWKIGFHAQPRGHLLHRHRIACRVTLRALCYSRDLKTWYDWLDIYASYNLLAANSMLPIKPLRPYMASNWTFSQRVKCLQTTLTLLFSHGDTYANLLDGKSIGLATLDLPEMPSITLLLTPNPNKEGELSLLLSVAGHNDFVARAIFSFDVLENKDFALRIACIQGNKTAYEIDRQLEKSMYGLRSKALLVFILQELAHTMEIHHVFGIQSNRHVFANKHSLSKLIGKNVRTLLMDYDALWLELDGVVQPDGWFRLPPRLIRRTREEMKPNKRSMYAKRYAMLDQIAGQIKNAMSSSQPPICPR